MDNGQAIPVARRSVIFMAFVLSALLVVFVAVTFASAIPRQLIIALQIGLIIIFLAMTGVVYRCQRLRDYWPVSFALFVAAAAIVFSNYAGELGVALVGAKLESAKGFTALKFTEDLVIIATIICFTVISRTSLGAIYLKLGNIKVGLIVGLSTFAACALLSTLQPAVSRMGAANALVLAPAILIIILADGFTEELLFRGLFLRKLEPFLGKNGSNLATALVYGLAHLQVKFTTEVWAFVAITFLLGLLWGWLMQKTDSILAPALFHAGMDALIIFDAFAVYGVTS